MLVYMHHKYEQDTNKLLSMTLDQKISYSAIFLTMTFIHEMLILGI